MSDFDYERWWLLHLRVAKGEILRFLPVAMIVLTTSSMPAFGAISTNLEPLSETGQFHIALLRLNRP
jgi:hypothetical protein